MTRKKVKLVFISNDSARKLCSKKRRLGLLKKVSELTLLCGVDAFCIIYSIDESEPVVWPSSPVVQNLLVKYLKLPDNERCKKSLNQESYLKERIGKAEDLAIKNLKKNKDMNLRCYMQHFHQGMSLDFLTADELTLFGWLVQEKMIEITKRMEYFDHTPPGSFFTYHVGGAHGMVNPCDIIQWNQKSAEVLAKNYDPRSDGSTNHDDIKVTFGINVNTLIDNSAINMAMKNHFYEDIHPRVTTIGDFNMESPNLVTNFNGGGLAINNVIDGSNPNRLKPSHGSLTNNVGYRGGFDFQGQTQGFGNNVVNVNAMNLGMPYGSRETSGHHQVPPYNYVESDILRRNYYNQIALPYGSRETSGHHQVPPYNYVESDILRRNYYNQIALPNEYINNFAANIGENEWNNSTIGLELSNHIHGNINFGGGSIVASDDISSQNTLFGSINEVQWFNTTTTTNNNNLAP